MLKKIETWYDGLTGRMTIVFATTILCAIGCGKWFFESRSSHHLASTAFWGCIAIVWFFRIRKERNARKNTENKEPDDKNDS